MQILNLTASFSCFIFLSVWEGALFPSFPNSHFSLAASSNGSRKCHTKFALKYATLFPWERGEQGTLFKRAAEDFSVRLLAPSVSALSAWTTSINCERLCLLSFLPQNKPSILH